MGELLKVIGAIIFTIVFSIVILACIDREVARRDFIKNVEQCQIIDGCLFEHNCNKYNKMIMEACND